MDDKKVFYTLDEVSELFRVRTRMVYSLVKRNEIPYIKIGGLLRFPAKEIDNLCSGSSSGKRLVVIDVDDLEKDKDWLTKREE